VSVTAESTSAPISYVTHRQLLYANHAQEVKRQVAEIATGTRCYWYKWFLYQVIRACLASRYTLGDAPGSKCDIVLAQGDITNLTVDAIVNAANNELRRGDGVCGSIFRAAGQRLDTTCETLNGCATGHAVLTESFNMRNVKAIVHAVGPNVNGPLNDLHGHQLASCYSRSLDVASKHGLTSIVCVTFEA
jgi:hypothetical protein